MKIILLPRVDDALSMVKQLFLKRPSAIRMDAKISGRRVVNNQETFPALINKNRECM